MLYSIANKYHSKPFECGVYDCNRMILEYFSYDLNQIKPYSNIRDGKLAIQEATGTNSPQDFLLSQGWSSVTPHQVEEGCVLIKGIHCFLYIDGMMFGVHPDTKSYEYIRADLDYISEFEVFKWQLL
ncbi:TPA: hypothetical protein ACPVXB_001022 [Vibrio parahaemolyticus]